MRKQALETPNLAQKKASKIPRAVQLERLSSFLWTSNFKVWVGLGWIKQSQSTDSSESTPADSGSPVGSHSHRDSCTGWSPSTLPELTLILTKTEEGRTALRTMVTRATCGSPCPLGRNREQGMDKRQQSTSALLFAVEWTQVPVASKRKTEVSHAIPMPCSMERTCLLSRIRRWPQDSYPPVCTPWVASSPELWAGTVNRMRYPSRD